MQAMGGPRHSSFHNDIVHVLSVGMLVNAIVLVSAMGHPPARNVMERTTKANGAHISRAVAERILRALERSWMYQRVVRSQVDLIGTCPPITTTA